jgi:hypothetical protein
LLLINNYRRVVVEVNETPVRSSGWGFASDNHGPDHCAFGNWAIGRNRLGRGYNLVAKSGIPASAAPDNVYATNLVHTTVIRYT